MILPWKRENAQSLWLQCAVGLFGADKEDDSERDLAGENGIEKYHLERAFRIMPHKTEGEGHFMAVLRRKEDGMGFSGKEACLLIWI